MRVILIHQYDPGIEYVGGIGTFIKTFVKYAPEDFEVSLVGVSADPACRPVGQWQRLRVEGRTCPFLPVLAAHPNRLGGIPLSLRLTAALMRFRHRIEAGGAILEFHRIEPSLAFKGFPNVKVLFLHSNVRDLANPRTEVVWGKFPWLYRGLERHLIRPMQRIYLVREDAVPLYRSRYPELAGRVGFLPTWVDETVFFPMAEEDRLHTRTKLAHEVGVDPRSRWLLFAGRFEGQKDPRLLLEAFRRLNGTGGQTVLILIGTGRLEASMRVLIQQQGLSPIVRMLPPQPQPQLARWMNAADCLVLSSAFEGMPRVVVEALGCGLPVVSTDVGEARRLVQNSVTGRLVGDRTPEAFAAGIAEVLRQPPDREACRRQIAPFTARKVLAPVYAAYRELDGALR